MKRLYLSAPIASTRRGNSKDFDRITNTAEAIVAKYYGQLQGAGAGFGVRDMDWLFQGDDDVAVERAAAELLAAFPDAKVYTRSAEDCEFGPPLFVAAAE